MAGRVAGKVAFITGAARGVGRGQAVRLAEEGADIIALDICGELPSIASYYEPATEEDLAETLRLVRAEGRRAVGLVADVRAPDAMASALAGAVAELGGLDIVSANAGVGTGSYLVQDMPETVWQEMIDTNLTGVWNTAKVAIPHLIARGPGGSITVTSSIAGKRGFQNISNYVAAKHGVVGLMRSLALELAPHMIRVNTIHPTQVDTAMIMNETAFKQFRPELEHPTVDDFAEASMKINLLPRPWIEAIDVSNALLFLASDEARYVTGATLPVDLGALTR